MIGTLDPTEWESLDALFAAEWDAALPDSRHARIVAESDGGELIGLLVVESVVRVGQIYVAPNHRGGGTARRLLSHVSGRVPGGTPVVVLADEARYEGLLERMGFRAVGGRAWRRDF